MEHVSSVRPTGKFPEKVENLKRWSRFPGWNFRTECRVPFPFLVVCTSSTGADPGFFLGGGALVSCSTSTPINHLVLFFFCRILVVLENRRSSQGGVRTPCTLPLDPPLFQVHRGAP